MNARQLDYIYRVSTVTLEGWPTHSLFKMRSPTRSHLDMPKHTCSVCYRIRSSSYQERHPLRLGDIPTQKICSRCVKRALQHIQSSKAIVYEVHHYHYILSAESESRSIQGNLPIELPASFPLPECAELPSDSSRFGSLQGNSPPLVRLWRKPNCSSLL